MYFIIAILLFYNYHLITISGNLHMGLAFESGPITLVALINFLLNTKTAASSTCDMVLTETALWRRRWRPCGCRLSEREPFVVNFVIAKTH